MTKVNKTVTKTVLMQQQTTVFDYFLVISHNSSHNLCNFTVIIITGIFIARKLYFKHMFMKTD